MFLSLRLQRLAHQIHLPRPSCISVIPAGHQEDVMKTSRKHVYPYYPYTSIYRIIQDHKYLLPTGLLTPQPSKALLWCREVRATAQAYIASHRQKMAKVWVRAQACFFSERAGLETGWYCLFPSFWFPFGGVPKLDPKCVPNYHILEHLRHDLLLNS